MKRVGQSSAGLFSPYAKVSQIQATDVQWFLQSLFTEWGLPQCLRVDNGLPWSTQTDVPSALTLWLIGLGIEVRFSRPHHSTDNAVVERAHGVLARWVEASTLTDLTMAQARLDWAMTQQRAYLPSCHAQTRYAAYPALFTNPRRYRPEQESDLWSLARIDTYLASQIWYRWVDKSGRVSLFGSPYYVGRSYIAQQLTIRFDPDSRAWQFYDGDGNLVRSHPTQEILPDVILQFHLTARQRSNFVA